MARFYFVRKVLRILIILALSDQLLLGMKCLFPISDLGTLATPNVFFSVASAHGDTVEDAEWSQVDIDGHGCLQNSLHGPGCLQDALRHDKTVSTHIHESPSALDQHVQTSAEGELRMPDNSGTMEDTEVPVDISTLSGSALVFQTFFSVACVTTRTISPPRNHEPPVHVVVASPIQSGIYPVILFKHGFAIPNCFYTQLFQNLAASGFIVVAPQEFTLNTDATEEIEETAEVANWILKSLAVVLSATVPNVSVLPDVSNLVMAGHSRGGKVAFALVLGKTTVKIPSFSALIALDPVDGISSDALSNPPIVATGCDHTLNFVPSPVLILGTGYGSQSGMLPGMPPCAPACCNHAAYFNCSSPPMMYHFVASEFGHMDFLDDGQVWTSAMCMRGSSRAPLRDFTGGIVVAFLETVLQGKGQGMADMVDNWESASIKLEEPQVFSSSAQRAPF